MLDQGRIAVVMIVGVLLLVSCGGKAAINIEVELTETQFCCQEDALPMQVSTLTIRAPFGLQAQEVVWAVSVENGHAVPDGGVLRPDESATVELWVDACEEFYDVRVAFNASDGSFGEEVRGLVNTCYEEPPPLPSGTDRDVTVPGVDQLALAPGTFGAGDPNGECQVLAAVGAQRSLVFSCSGAVNEVVELPLLGARGLAALHDPIGGDAILGAGSTNAAIFPYVPGVGFPTILLFGTDGPNYTDASATADGATGWVVNYTAGTVEEVTYDLAGPGWVRAAIPLPSPTAPGSRVLSAYPYDGGVGVLFDSGEVWVHRGAVWDHIGTTSVSSPLRLRGLPPFLSVASETTTTMTVFFEGSAGWQPPQLVPAGDGQIGHDWRAAGGTHELISTGMNDDTLNVHVFGSDGSLLTTHTRVLPAGSSPTCAIWLDKDNAAAVSMKDKVKFVANAKAP